MTILDEDLWTTASRDLAAEDAERRLAVSRVRCAPLWKFLAASGSTPEYIQRRALVADQIAEAAEGDPLLAGAVTASLDVDFQAVLAARPKRPEPERHDDAALSRMVQAALDPDAEREARRGLWRAVGHPMPTDPHAGAEASAFVSWYAQHHFPGAQSLRDLPDPVVAWHGFVEDRHRPMSATTARALRDRLAAAHLASEPAGEPEQEPEQPGEPAPAPEPQPEPEAPVLSIGAPRAARRARKVAACRKCARGRTPDGAACQYCDGQGRLDRTLAMVKHADGWDQGLVAMTREGAVQFDPSAFGSERYQKLPTPPRPAWIVDPWALGTNVPLEGAGPPPVTNQANGQELADARAWRREKRAAAGDRENPYADPDKNPYLTRGPGLPATVAPDAAVAGPATAPPLASGAAQPIVRDPELPHPEDDPDRERRQSARRPDPRYTQPSTDVIDRLAARVLAANPQLKPHTARRVAQATVSRFTAMRG